MLRSPARRDFSSESRSFSISPRSSSASPPSPIWSPACRSAISAFSASRVLSSRLTPSMPPLLTGGRSCVIKPAEPEKPEAKPQTDSLLLESPVRSGQSVVFTEGDVTVLGSVGSGAEIVAGGSIHVYGTLRGRAMAGVNGNSARGSTARKSKRSFWQSTATTRLQKKSTNPCAIGPPRPGSTAMS